jgi:hypothetical protein
MSKYHKARIELTTNRDVECSEKIVSGEEVQRFNDL